MVVTKVTPLLFCSLLLSKLIKIYQMYKGHNNPEYRITEFADDTTLLLDVSRKPLHASLNTLEKFSSISALKLNTMNPKVI